MLGYWRHMDEELQPYRDVEIFIGRVAVDDERATDVPIALPEAQAMFARAISACMP